MDIPEINRPARALVEQLREMGAATVAGTLAHMGIRDFEAVNALAERAGLKLVTDVAMPANNRTLVWAK